MVEMFINGKISNLNNYRCVQGVMIVVLERGVADE
jgi:hypothetical protein